MGEKIIFSLIKSHFLKYNKPPTTDSIAVDLTSKNLNETHFDDATRVLDAINDKPIDVNWLVDTTEDWCKKRAFFNAILSASDLIDKDDTALYHGALDQVTKALAVSFDSDLGSDYFEDAEDRFDRYKAGVDKIPVTFESFNKSLKGGVVIPSLTVFIAPTGVGKSLFLCNFAADFLRQGKNVLYFTMEMSQTQVEQRIDLNLLDLRLDQLDLLEKEQFLNRIVNVKKTGMGKLRTKEYPSGTAHSGHFRYFIEELKLKEGFIPDVIIVDYLNICSSARVTKASGLYDFNRSISEELRGLGQEYKCPVFTATQTNREGAKAIDFESTDVADSFGITYTADYIYGIVETEELAKMGHMKINRLKDRYFAVSAMPYFHIGVNKDKQRIYDLQVTTDTEDDFEEVNNKFMSLIT